MTVEVDLPAALEQFEDAALIQLQDETYEDNDDFDDDDFDDDFAPSGGGGGGKSVVGKKMNFSHSVSNSVSKMQDLEVKKRTLHTSRDDRATSEQCLDPRTRLMLFKMLSNGMLDEIDGCLSTGKEANVYYAKAGRKSPNKEVTEFAIKIFKTSILVFKDRDKYVSGEHRWRKGYCTFCRFAFFEYRKVHVLPFSHSPTITNTTTTTTTTNRQIQSSENGQSVGGKGNAQLPPHSPGGYSMPDSHFSQDAHFGHGIFGGQRVAVSSIEGCGAVRQTHTRGLRANHLDPSSNVPTMQIGARRF
jgi:hypothetical protein